MNAPDEHDTPGQLLVEAEQLVRELADELSATIERGREEAELSSSLAAAAESIARTAQELSESATALVTAQQQVLAAGERAEQRYAELDTAELASTQARTNDALAALQRFLNEERTRASTNDAQLRDQAEALTALADRLAAVETHVGSNTAELTASLTAARDDAKAELEVARAKNRDLERQLEEVRALVPARKLGKLTGA